jgi:hypothetical protein
MVKHPRRVDQSNLQLAWTFALRFIVEPEGEFPCETVGASKPDWGPRHGLGTAAGEPPTRRGDAGVRRHQRTSLAPL